jgi:hypothetical protein
MDSIDGTNDDGPNGMDNMDTIEFDPHDPANGATNSAGAPGRARWSGRTKRIVTSVAASTVLLSSGAAAGVALTGGASASTSGTSPGASSNSAAATTAASSLAGRCARLAQRLQNDNHAVAATRLRALCRNPLRRLLLVDGEHGELTFQTKAGPETIAFERGTIQAVSSSSMTVQAKDGTTWTWDFTTSTKVREARQAVGQDKLSTGETVLVAGQVVSGVNDARLIRIGRAS